MKLEVKIKVDTVEEAKSVLNIFDTAEIRKNHPNVKVTIEVAHDAIKLP